MEQFDSINAPQFYNFTEGTSDQTTSFFGKSNENEATGGSDGTVIEASSHHEGNKDHRRRAKANKRRSMSCDDISYLSEAIDNLIITHINRDDSSDVGKTLRRTKKDELEVPAQPKTRSNSHEPSSSIVSPEIPKRIRNEPKATNSRVIKNQQQAAIEINFHAKPAPNLTEKVIADKNQKKIENNSRKNKPKTTKVSPFSFVVRDAILQKKKEKPLKRVFEAEKMARVFRARPIPRGLLLPVKTVQKAPVETAGHMPMFKARSPKVLQTKPFEPKKSEKTPTKVEEFVLNTDKRSKVREELQKQLKQKEADKERAKQALEDERKELRKKTTFVATPIKKS